MFPFKISEALVDHRRIGRGSFFKIGEYWKEAQKKFLGGGGGRFNEKGTGSRNPKCLEPQGAGRWEGTKNRDGLWGGDQLLRALRKRITEASGGRISGDIGGGVGGRGRGG